MDTTSNIYEDNVLTGIIIILALLLIYLFFFREESDGVDAVSDSVNNVNDSVDPDDNETLLKSDEPYTVSVGNPKLITRCKPLPSTKISEKLDFGYKAAYIPNSRGNICDKGNVDSSALFPSLSDENVLDNVNPDGNIIVPVSSFTGDEAPFVANCSFNKPGCDQQTTVFPGEILIKESLSLGASPESAKKDTVENFVNYYEGFIEGQGKDEDSEPESTEKKEKVVCTMYYVDWCPHCQKVKPEWDDFKKSVGSKRNGRQVVIKKVNCEKEKEICEAAKVEGYPTITFKCGDDVEYYEKERTEQGFLSFLDSFIKSLGGN